MSRDNHRRKWNEKERAKLKVETENDARVPSEPSKHEEYLILLQEKNRLARQLKTKSNEQVKLEEKEKGFSLYVNGPSPKNKRQKTPATSRPPKTRPEFEVSRYPERKYRSKTAPDQPRRRNWHARSINIKTDEGDRIRLKAPDILTGEYEDDFEKESMNVVDQRSSGSSQGSQGNSSDSEEEDNALSKQSGEEENSVTLTIDDVKKLRQSLVMNDSIRKSLAYHSSESESENECEEVLSGGEEAIEEELPADGGDAKPLYGAKDLIVLEFNSPKEEKAMRSLKAARKKEAEEYVKLSSSKDKSQKADRSIRSPKKEKKEIFLKSQAKKSSRPLSASRRKDAEVTDSTSEAKSVLDALQKENSSLSSASRRGTQSAPGRPEHEDNEYEIEDEESSPIRPHTTGWKEQLKPTQLSSSIPSGTGGRTCWPPQAEAEEGENLDHIVKKVLQLDTKGQKRLLKALARIEDGTSPTKPARESKKPLKATKPVANMVKKQFSPSGRSVDVIFELLSNWGHPSRVGLTEIQFFDTKKQRLYANTSQIKVQGATNAQGELGAMFNGKAKTTRERNMWSCAFSNTKRVRIRLSLHSTDSAGVDLSYIKVWNYNKSLQELKIGVCHLRVMLDGEVYFDGELEKGCGNQVFDYGMKIPVKDTDQNSDETDEKQQKDPSTETSHGRSPDEAANKRSRTPNEGAAKGSRTPSDGTAKGSRTPSEGATKGSRTASEGTTKGCPESPRSLSHIDNVLFHSEDFSDNSESQLPVPPLNLAAPPPPAPVRSSTRILNYSVERELQLPVVPSPRSSRTPRSAHSDASLESQLKNARSNSRSRSQSKERKKESEECTILTTPRSPAVRRRNSLKKLEKENSVEEEERKNSGSDKSPENETYSSLVKRKKKKKVRASKMAARLDGSGSSVDNAALFREMEQQNSSRDKTALWLDRSSLSSADGDRVRYSEDLLDNWPKSSSRHLPTMLDEEGGRSSAGSARKRPEAETTFSTEQPSRHGRRSQQSRGPEKVADDAEEEAYRNKVASQMEAKSRLEESLNVPRMKQIEAARAQWRKQEQSKLEESWSSLNIFNRSHKGRLSLDMESDVMDEYLKQEPQRPSEPTITEEETEMPEEEEECFTIPELPRGKRMVINIKTTWGDHHYVGLNGLEIFSSSGEQAEVVDIRADPSDINILPEYEKDPRVVSNLIDSVNRTRDDVHMWLAPFRKERDHKIFLTFKKEETVAMMRIWNYNKSRIHSYRGARYIEISLDDLTVFKGEITRACGGVMGGSEAFGDTILFTMDEAILEEVSKYDKAFEADALMELDSDDEEVQRPVTADRETMERPFTCAARQINNRPEVEDRSSEKTEETFVGQDLEVNFTATWGDIYYLGLTGMEVVGQDGEGLDMTLDMLEADPRDLHVLPGYEHDDRTLDKLINGINITTSDENMWLIPYTDGEDHCLRIHFKQPEEIVGLRFWNYNKSPEDTYRGAKVCHVSLDGRQLSPPDGFLIRKGPGNCHFDFAQEISFTQPASSYLSTIALQEKIIKPSESTNLMEEYEATQIPCGYIYQLQLMTTWGDPYYVGLNGLEFYDVQGNKLDLTENNIAAYPSSVNVLEAVEGDVRTPDKLINGINESPDGKSMWLAPILPGILNKIYVIFDMPMQVSMIKLWNYSKTANRGVKDFAVLVDDLLVYNGVLKQVLPSARGILPTCDIPNEYHTVLFSDDLALRDREKGTIILNQAREQDVQLMNDCQVVSRYQDPQNAHVKQPDQALRPKTSMVDRRPKKLR